MGYRRALSRSLLALGGVLLALGACGPGNTNPPILDDGVNVRVIVEGPGRVTWGPVIACFDDCVWSLPAGEEVTIMANESPSGTFLAWDGDCPTFPQGCRRVFQEGDTVIAKFARHALRLRLTGDGVGVFRVAGGGLDVTCDGSCGIAVPEPLQLAITLFAQGTTMTTAADWGGACAGATNPNYCLVQVSGGVDVTKRWVHPPVASPTAFTMNWETTLEVPAPGVLAFVDDTPGDTHTAELVSGVANGSLTLAPTGGFNYTPVDGFSGTDGFSYRARDAFGNLSNVATVTITVEEVNRPPVANDVAYEVDVGETLIVPAPGVLENDTDRDGDELTAVRETDVGHGTLILDPDGGFSYTPADGFTGEDAFTYRASDGELQSEPATVTITVVQPNRPPVANDDDYEVDAGETLIVPAPGVLINDTDPDGDDLTAVLETSVSNGTLELAPDGGFNYTPNDGFTGEDTFTYRASDGELQSEPATVTITVTAVTAESAPEAVDDAYRTTKNTTLNEPAPGVLANDHGSPLWAVLDTDVANGSLTLDADGGFTYVPRSGYSGTDAFTYRAHDGVLASKPATVTIEVTAR